MTGGRRLALLVASVTPAMLVVGPADAQHRVGHEPPPGPAAVRFAPDFPALLDSEWGFPLGGFGGVARGAPLAHAPVIFVHGNNVDHADWYPVRDDFLAAGWTDQELWGPSYNGLGAANGSSPRRSNPERDAEHDEMGGDGVARVTANDVNVPDLAAFIRAVQDYTGSRAYSLVGHSLGVTVARRTLVVHPDLAEDLVAFVGIAGGNHGTSVCPPGSEGAVHSCDEIAPGTAWLEELNGPDGERETYGATAWMTVYDGSGAADIAFLWQEAQSPALRGADNRQYPGVDHNGLRMDPAIVADYRIFIEQAEAARASAAVPAVAADPETSAAPAAGDGQPDPLPVTGGGLALAGVAMATLGRLRRH